MLQELDRQLFEMINKGWSHPALDIFFPFWTDIQRNPIFIALIALCLFFLIFKKRWKSLFIIVSCVAGSYLADVINAKILKQIFERPRPVDVILRTAHQGSYSFPSSHAVDVFFITMFLGLFIPRLRIFLFPLATLTALSRVYCGVHYPGDILAGALVGMLLAFIFYKGIIQLMKTKLKFLTCLALLAISSMSFALEIKDPTEGKPFFPWVWEDQLQPTLRNATDGHSVSILLAGTASTVVVHQYDEKIYNFSENGGNLWMSESTAEKFGSLGNGMAGVLIAATQLVFDQENGLRTTQALLLTTVSHISLAAIFQRERPNEKSDFLPFPSSFPSGHASSAFAVAGSLAYSYGWAGAIPGYFFASGIALSRIKENRHWASDVVAGGFLGTFWARAAFKKTEVDKEAFMVIPSPIFDGMMLTALKEF
jgi:undecaprenyl-diphosphatase